MMDDDPLISRILMWIVMHVFLPAMLLMGITIIVFFFIALATAI